MQSTADHRNPKVSLSGFGLLAIVFAAAVTGNPTMDRHDPTIPEPNFNTGRSGTTTNLKSHLSYVFGFMNVSALQEESTTVASSRKNKESDEMKDEEGDHDDSSTAGSSAVDVQQPTDLLLLQPTVEDDTNKDEDVAEDSFPLLNFNHQAASSSRTSILLTPSGEEITLMFQPTISTPIRVLPVANNNILQVADVRVEGGASSLVVFGQVSISALRHVVSHLSLPDVASCRLVSQKFRQVAMSEFPMVPAAHNSMAIFLQLHLNHVGEVQSCTGSIHPVVPSATPRALKEAAGPFIATTTDSTTVATRNDNDHLLLQAGGDTTTAPTWNCGHCTSTTPNHLTAPRCASCGEERTVQRVFVGQLRKDFTVEALRRILNLVLPGIQIVHIESHTNGVSGRGKGCAWVYLASAKDTARLLSMNKRLFHDVDRQGQEGIWLVGPEEDHKSWLSCLAKDHAFRRNRPIVLPRQPIVVEVPSAKNRLNEGVRQQHTSCFSPNYQKLKKSPPPFSNSDNHHPYPYSINHQEEDGRQLPAYYIPPYYYHDSTTDHPHTSGDYQHQTSTPYYWTDESQHHQEQFYVQQRHENRHLCYSPTTPSFLFRYEGSRAATEGRHPLRPHHTGSPCQAPVLRGAPLNDVQEVGKVWVGVGRFRHDPYHSVVLVAS